MNNVIQMQKRNVQNATLQQLKREWSIWSDYPGEDLPDGVEFHYEQIHHELNRRGHGEFCAV